ncbi:MAG: DUF2269 domain-containing protein [Actinomycetota bacterium]|nr:DUF2269 domain-containing protein [Actinomycetota bacterium]
MYEFLLTIHVLAAVIWVGGGLAMHILGRRVLKRGDPQEIFEFSKEINTVAMRLYAPTALILLIAGVLLVNEAGYEFSQLWITLAFIGWAFSFIVGVGYYGPQDKKLQTLVAADGPTATGVVENVRQALFVNQIEQLILILVVIDMTTKPGL